MKTEEVQAFMATGKEIWTTKACLTPVRRGRVLGQVSDIGAFQIAVEGGSVETFTIYDCHRTRLEAAESALENARVEVSSAEAELQDATEECEQAHQDNGQFGVGA